MHQYKHNLDCNRQVRIVGQKKASGHLASEPIMEATCICRRQRLATTLTATERRKQEQPGGRTVIARIALS